MFAKFLQQESRVAIPDNSGALKGKIIYIKKKFHSFYGLTRLTKINTTKTYKRSTLLKIAVTGHKYPFVRKSGVTVKADKNECVTVKKDNSPIFTRLYKSINLELKFSGFIRVCGLTRNMF